MLNFLCLQCKTLLRQTARSFLCPQCNATYPVRDGIPSFSSTDSHYPGALTKQQKDMMIEIAEKKGWDKALNDFVRPINLDAYHSATDYSRADGKFLLPLTGETKVLDWGSGWGIISLALARTCRYVVSLDEDLQRLRFFLIRIIQSKTDNITLVHGGGSLELPFPDAEFDLVVMNGVLEWTGVSSPEKDPFLAHKKALNSVQHCLRGGGIFYLAIENRFGYKTIMGAKDHNGLRFVGILPRKLADFYCLLRGKEKYKTPVYSFDSYKKLLTDAGFEDITFYLPVPNYFNPRFIMPLNDLQVLSYYMDYLFPLPLEKSNFSYSIIRMIGKFLMRLHLIHYFVPGYVIICKKTQ
jgi:SAM-dependent methyltransferase